MAIAGSMGSAYRLKLVGEVLIVTPTTYPLAQCDGVDAAVEKIRRGETAIVAGRDAAAVRVAVTGKTITGGNA